MSPNHSALMTCNNRVMHHCLTPRNTTTTTTTKPLIQLKSKSMKMYLKKKKEENIEDLFSKMQTK